MRTALARSLGQDPFVQYTPEGLGQVPDDLLAAIERVKRQARGVALRVGSALRDPKKVQQLASLTVRSLARVTSKPEALEGLFDRLKSATSWVAEKVAAPAKAVASVARTTVDYAQDVVIGGKLGHTALLRHDAEMIADMAEDRFESGAMTAEAKDAIITLKDEAIDILHKPTSAFVETAAEEIGKNVSGLFKWMKFITPFLLIGGVGIVGLVGYGYLKAVVPKVRA